MNIQNILRILLVEADLNESELSRHTGIAKSTISNILNHNSNPTYAVLKEIAGFFGITISQLIGEEKLPENRIKGLYLPKPFTSRLVPVLCFTQINDYLRNNLSPTQNVQQISSEHELNEKSFAIYIDSSQYGALIPKNSLVIVNLGLEPSYGDIVLVKLHGSFSLSLKQLLVDNQFIYLKSLDQNFDTTQKIGSDDIVYGTVVEQRMYFSANPKNSHEQHGNPKRIINFDEIAELKYV
jgi:transcriptional regulator with XRE-family HTH domain